MAGFGEALRIARQAKGWTQGQLAAAVGASQKTVSYWETEDRQPKVADLLRLEAVLGVSFRPDQPPEVFERGFAAGEFGALAAMAEAIAERARAAVLRLAPADPLATAPRAVAGVRHAHPVASAKRPKVR